MRMVFYRSLEADSKQESLFYFSVLVTSLFVVNGQNWTGKEIVKIDQSENENGENWPMTWLESDCSLIPGHLYEQALYTVIL